MNILVRASLGLALISCGRATASLRPSGMPTASQLARESESSDQASWFEQRVDHRSPQDGRTFKQRYFLDSRWAVGDEAPIFLFICGEGPCSYAQMESVAGGHSQAYGGHMLALEHRYYGLSFPTPDFTTEQLRFLSTDQALEDLSDFVTAVKNRHGWRGPVIAMGGSYAGSLAAYLRALHPDLVSGAMASSGPVRAKEQFSEYDLHAAKALGEECAQATRAFIAVVDQALAQGNQVLALIKTAFQIPDSATPYEIASYLTHAPSLIAQYGVPKDPYCQAMQTEPLTAKLQVLPATLKLYQDADEPSRDLSDSALPNGTEAGGRAWFYQVCTEYGYWQTAAAERRRSVWSRFVDLEHARADCARIFGLTLPAQVEQTNRTYFDRLQQASRIFFSNGELDPWSELSITTPDVSRGIEAVVIAGGHHCDDLFPEQKKDSVSLLNTRQTFKHLLTAWLGPPQHISLAPALATKEQGARELRRLFRPKLRRPQWLKQQKPPR